MNLQSQIVNLQFLIAAGVVASAAMYKLATGGLQLGSPAFLAWTGAAAFAWAGALAAIWRGAGGAAALVIIALFGIAMRAPMAAAEVGPGSDVLRYVWDARVQRAGLSPYAVIPDDPAVAHLHTAQTRAMNNVDITSPYPPGAQIFFRLATLPRESAHVVKLALVACDILTAIVIVLWLRSRGSNPAWVVAYAWNPLVLLEVAYSGHLDAAGMLMVAIAAYALTRRWIAVSVAALVAGIAIKFLPIVLVPLWWGRARLRHAALGAGLLAAMYLMFVDFGGGTAPVGSVTNMVQGFRFNGPAFKAMAFVAGPWVAAAAGLALALYVAWRFRQSRLADDPAAFAWPMAAALVCAPVVYPWYLLWLTPFFISAFAWPLVLWSLLILPVYIVWHTSAAGGIWAVPIWMWWLEYGALGAGAWALYNSRMPWPRTRK